MWNPSEHGIAAIHLPSSRPPNLLSRACAIEAGSDLVCYM